MTTLFRTAALLLLSASLSPLFYQCTADELPEPTPLENCDPGAVSYEANIRQIVDNTCAYSGCHLDSAPGTYDSYEGLQNILANGKFLERVVTLRDDPFLGMPPDNAPVNRARNLSAEELQLLQCWLEAGYPE